jgi:tRNA nucleotidyltransferase (CCA-adding enzyme)
MKEGITREEKSFGIIPFIRTQEAYLFLIVRSAKNNHWGFPKGREETNETPLDVAKRELKEEVGIEEYKIIDSPVFSEEYFFDDRETPCHKVVKYFLGEIQEQKITLDPKEISEYKLEIYEKTLSTLSHPESKKILQEAYNFLKSN